MVVRVYGSCNNGPQINFVRGDGNEWKLQVPASPDGEYIIALWAEDEYGNTAYYATMLFIIKVHEVVAIKKLPDYFIQCLGSWYRADRSYVKREQTNGERSFYFRGEKIRLL